MRTHALAVLLLASAATAQSTLTAGEAIAKIQKFYVAAPPAKTVDTIKAGDPSTPVTGIAFTFLDTMDVLREANRQGLNLVITHEPTFYNHLDDARIFKNDPVYKEKLAFIRDHGMVVFRLHDEIHASSKDPILPALVEALRHDAQGRELGTVDTADPSVIRFRTVTLREFTANIRRNLRARTVRIVGNPAQIVHSAIVRPGAASLETQVNALEKDGIDVLIAGEASEWETVEYARDATSQRRQKALILIGHEPSEEPGMAQATQQIQPFFPNIRVLHIPAKQSMWSYPPSHSKSNR